MSEETIHDQLRALREDLGSQFQELRGEIRDDVRRIEGAVSGMSGKLAVLEDHDRQHGASIAGFGARLGQLEVSTATQRATAEGEKAGGMSTRGVITWVLASVISTGAIVGLLSQMLR